MSDTLLDELEPDVLCEATREELTCTQTYGHKGYHFDRHAEVHFKPTSWPSLTDGSRHDNVDA